MATKTITEQLSPTEVAAARTRRLAAQNLQNIEGNPLTAEEVEMFEMFERERWTHDQRRAYIIEGIKARATIV